MSATMVRARLALRIDGQDVDAWGWTEQPSTIRHGDTSMTFTTGNHLTLAAEDRGPLGDENEFLHHWPAPTMSQGHGRSPSRRSGIR